MKFTGERLHSDIKEYWAIEHYHRYALASQFATGKVVLDIACGEGYGSHFLSGIAKRVTGVDISPDAVEFAKKEYSKNNLEYVVGSADRIPLLDHSVDIVVSFETIEHHDKHQEMMREIKRVLKPEGHLIISSPDKKYYSDVPNYKNPFHVKELYQDEFKSLLSTYFRNTVHFSQKTVYGSLIVSNDHLISGFTEFTGDSRKVSQVPEMKGPIYNLAICSDGFIDLSEINNSVFNSEIDVEATIASALKKQQAEIAKSYQQSRSFRIGKLITSPFRIVGNLFK